MRSDGVRWYTTATVEIHFPEDHVSCSLCPMLETHSRNQCRRTGEYLIDTKNTTGFMCPLKFEEEEHGES